MTVSLSENDSSAFIAAVRRDLFLARSDDNWSDEDILGVADDCLCGPIAAALKAAKQEFFACDFDVELVADQSTYDLPGGSMWSSIENAYLIDKTTGRIVSTFLNISESQRPLQQPGNDNLSGTPQAVWMQHTQLNLTPAPDSNAVASYSLTVAGYRRPGKLIKTDQCARFLPLAIPASVDADMVGSMYLYSSTSTAAMTSLPSLWVADSWGRGNPDHPYIGTYDVEFYGAYDPHTRRMPSVCVASITSSGPSNPLAANFDPADTYTPLAVETYNLIQKSDVICPAGTTPFVSLPREGLPYLRRMVMKTISVAQTDPQALQAYLAEESAALAAFMKGMKNRHDGKGRKVSLWNAAGSRFMRRRW